MAGIGPATSTLPRWCYTTKPHQHVLLLLAGITSLSAGWRSQMSCAICSASVPATSFRLLLKRKKTMTRCHCFNLELLTGLEPVTSALPRQCATDCATTACFSFAVFAKSFLTFYFRVYIISRRLSIVF